MSDRPADAAGASGTVETPVPDQGFECEKPAQACAIDYGARLAKMSNRRVTGTCQADDSWPPIVAVVGPAVIASPLFVNETSSVLRKKVFESIS